MYCSKCGANVPEGAGFCPACGNNTAAEQSAPQAQQPVQPQYQQPVQPQYQQPVQPQYQQPVQPQYRQPVQPQYQQPVQPQYQQPVHPGYQQPYQSGYQQPVVVNNYIQTAPPPARQLKTNRALWKFIVFGIITFGIYEIVYFSNISVSLNTAASRYDGQKTMHFCLVTFVFSWLTFGIVPLIWFHRMSGRVGRELQRRGISYSFGAGMFWLWFFLGSVFVAGPFIYIYKLSKAMNKICEDYNVKG